MIEGDDRLRDARGAGDGGERERGGYEREASLHREAVRRAAPPGKVAFIGPTRFERNGAPRRGRGAAD